MFERLKRLYEQVRITKEELRNAVVRNWITPEEYAEITGEPYNG